MNVMAIIFLVASFICGCIVSIFCIKLIEKKQLGEAKSLANKILDEAKKEAKANTKEMILQAQDEINVERRNIERELKEKEKELREDEKELKRVENRLETKEERLDKKAEDITQREVRVHEIEEKMERVKLSYDEKNIRLDGLITEQKVLLQQVAGLSVEEAKNRLLKEIESEARHESAKLSRQIEAEAVESANRESRKILALAVQRYAGDYAAETTVSVINLPNDEMKGRIIGREGRNIRALEAATGVDLIIDDTPETIVLSAFSPYRREIARLSLERLMSDGRIHPTRIEEVVKKSEEEMEAKIREIGEQATFDVGVHGIHPEIIRLLGRLYYRTSYSQNVLQHSIEAAFLAGIMAAELGIDVKTARRAAFLHDIGKALDHEVEGSHATIGADLLKKYGENLDIIHAVASHHEDIPALTALANIVQAADSLSSARPGARKELLESYVKRLEDLEGIARSFDGVDNAFAIQAGREVRVMVDCERVGDDAMFLLSKDIARSIEENMTYPGQIKVTVIRESRVMNLAK